MRNRRHDPIPELSRPAERFDRGLWASVVMHLALGGVIVAAPSLFPAFGEVPWGSEDSGGGSISVQLVASETGIPLPAPLMTSPDAVGNDSAGFYSTESPVSEPAAEDTAVDAEPIPETFAAEPEEPEDRVEEAAAPPRPQPAEPTPAPAPAPPPVTRQPPPDNAVPFGEGGQPDVNSGFSTPGQGSGGIGIGDGAFGQRFGRYVRAMTRRVSDNWYQSMVDANVPRGLRVTLGFEVLRNGTIRDVHIVDSSGVRSLDDSAERAILRVRQLEPLPPEYRGTSIDVEFWFEFTR